jgi:hypothetical protein
MSNSITSAQIIEIAKKKKYEKDRMISLMLMVVQHHQICIKSAAMGVKSSLESMERCGDPGSFQSYHMDFDITKHAAAIQTSQMVLYETVMMLRRALIERGEKIEDE